MKVKFLDQTLEFVVLEIVELFLKDSFKKRFLAKEGLRQFFRFKRLAVKWCIIPCIKDHVNDQKINK